jgi:hypothetical protein
MSRRLRALLCALVLLPLGRTAAPAGEPAPLRVLFVGNSQLYTCDVPRMVQELADSAPAGRTRIAIGRAILGGRGLQGYWEAGDATNLPRGKIAAGGWDCVVLQEAYDIWDEPFEEYAGKFVDLIRQHGAQPILFATASISSLYPDGFTRLNDPQVAWARARGLRCAAAGYAWMDYLGTAPTREELLDLYAPDTKHPGRKGSYLYACVLYAALTGASPEGLTRSFPHLDGEVVTADEAARMQTIAWKRYRDVPALAQ